MGTVRDAVRVGRSICYTLFFLLWRGVVDDVLGMNRLSRASRRPERRRACFGMVVLLLLLCEKKEPRRDCYMMEMM